MAQPRSARPRRRPTLAERADRHALYQRAVQCPEYDIDLFVKWYRELRGRRPLVLREDFCGTGHCSATWVKGHPERRAIGVDLDEPTLAWGRAHEWAQLGPRARRRLQLVCADVRDVTHPKADLTCAMNFSYCVFKTRAELGQYFRAVYAGLRPDGVFISELYGGTEAIVATDEQKKVGRVTYVFEQAKYNPITHETLCHIHFRFPDGSKLERAFTYDWRLWTIPEVRECLLEAGFRLVDVYWDDDVEDDEGDWQVAHERENQESWLVYVVAAK